MTANIATPGDTFVGLAILAAVLIWCLAAALRRGRAQVDAVLAACLDREAGDWSEPSREQVEWEAHLAEAIRLTEADQAAWGDWNDLPIYTATAAHIAKHAAAELDDEWARLNGGAS